jgi:hypothetical protein
MSAQSAAGGLECCARGAAGDAACCFSGLGGSLAAAVSGCVITRKCSIGSGARGTQCAVAKHLDPEVDVGLPDLPDRPPGMRWSRYNRLAERFEHQNNIWNLAMMKSIAFLLPRLQRRSGR